MGFLFALFFSCWTVFAVEDMSLTKTQKKSPSKKKKAAIKSHIKEEEYKIFRDLFAQYEDDTLFQRVDRIVWCLKHPHHPHMQEGFDSIMKEVRAKKFYPHLLGSMEWIKSWRDYRNTKLWQKVYIMVRNAFTGVQDAAVIADKLEKGLLEAQNITQK